MAAGQSVGGAGGRGVVVLVGSDGEPIGACEKLLAHRAPGQLHLAFSVFLFTETGASLFQRRADAKYHFAGWWANACCSHPAPGEELRASAEARVREELGLVVGLEEAGSFIYRAVDPEGTLVEHELDHVFVGELAEPFELDLDPEEVADWRLVAARELDARHFPEPLAPWVAEAYALAEGYRRRRADAFGEWAQGRPAP